MSSPTTDRRYGVNAGRAIKVPARAATTANVTLSGEQTVDGVALVTDDRALVKDQTAGTENGIYLVDTGTWTRAADFDGNYDVSKGTLVFVNEGSTNNGFWYVSAADPITIDTTAITFAKASSVLAVVSAFVQNLLDDVDAATARATLGAGITNATEQATTSGTAIDFTGIPAGVKRITVMFNGVSTSGTSDLIVQIGDAGGIEIAGYTPVITNGFTVVDPPAAADTHSGACVLYLENAATFQWLSASSVFRSSDGANFARTGRKALSAELDRVRITTAGGTDTFDAGSVNIAYEL